ncbi:MAG: ACT domain-containing protein [Candidatus Aenigmatarchaeota archaeon]
MRNSNVTRLDQKGRILIPNHIRKDLKMENGTEIVIIPDGGKNEARILPLLKGKTIKFRFLISDIPGSLATIASILGEYNVNIVLSESRTLVKNKLAEWDIIADVSECRDLNKLKDILMRSSLIKNMEILK